VLNGRYEIRSQLGRGGMGEVWRALDGRLGREVAIKFLPADYVADPERLNRFEIEARASAALSHPNILAVHDVGTLGGQPYLITELLEGQTLGERIHAGDLTMAKAVEIATQIVHGLAAAHDRGIVHRDLKPENLFVTRDGHVKILDFGLARLTQPDATSEEHSSELATEAAPTRQGSVLGTVGYMAPEQARGLATDSRTDIFAFGCVLFEMLAGVRAFRGSTSTDVLAALLKDDPPPLPDKVPPALDRIVRQCLEKRPQDRFSSAHDLALALQAVAQPSGSPVHASSGTADGSRAKMAGMSRMLPKLAVAAVAAFLLTAAVVVGARLFERRENVAWARGQAIPEVMRLADAQEHWAAFVLARQVEDVLPGDPLLEELRPQFAADLVWQVVPEGADVYARGSTEGEEDWIYLGRASGGALSTPIGCTFFKVEQPGSETFEFSMSLTYTKGTLPLALRPVGEHPRGMARIAPPDSEVDDYPSLFAYTAGAASHLIGTFLMDSTEVTNRDFKAFVDAGGYRRRELWTHEVTRDGAPLPWETAVATFVDATGRPGPANWELGSYPEGRADFPVTGVSWFEAAAYAAFVSKRLPTVHHWTTASGAANAGCLISGSNFSGGLAPVGSYRGSLNLRGLYDMAGNAREWCSTAAGGGRVVTAGGACDGPVYLFTDVDTRSPLERHPTTGFRCMLPVDPASVPEEIELPLPSPTDWGAEQPFSDEVWQTWLSLLAYPEASLDARTELVDESSPYWRVEKVSFAAAYGGERVIAYLFLPRNAVPPYQTVVFWPGAGARRFTSSDDGRRVSDSRVWGYLVRDGRAVLYPILKGTYERGGGAASLSTKELYLMGVKDISRCLDYLDGRGDVAKDRLAYMGYSWGAYMGTLVCAADARLKAATLICGGIGSRPEILGWARRVTIPTQMVNGRFDGLFPCKESQLPMFRTLGTPDTDKRFVLLDTDHQLSGADRDVMKANLEWLDRYLGPVAR
jgi:dienelactone hydrolase